MLRRLSKLLTALSLLLCVAVVALVAYSYWRAHSFGWGRREFVGQTVREARCFVSFRWGAVRVQRSRSTATYTSPAPAEELYRKLGPVSFYDHSSERAAAPREVDGSVWSRLGFHGYRASIKYPPTELRDGRGAVLRTLDETELAAPVWPLGLFGVLPPAFWGLRFARRRRARGNARRGLCAACGYDLTGNLSGVCPECGEPAR